MIWKILSLNLLLLFTSSSALLENLYQRESSCYSGCRSNYADQTSYADACKKGCDYKLHNEKCADQCSLVSSDPQLQASCLVGCSMVDSMKPQEVEPSLGDRPRSIILIRLRQRPLLQLPSFDKDPAEFFRDMIKQMSSGASGELKTVIHLTKNIPLIKLPDGPIRADSSSESSEEMGGHMKHFVIFRQGHQQPVNGRLQQITDSLKREWKDLIHRQPNVPIWLLLLFFLSLSALLWYMIVSLCSHAPTHRTLSIRAQELLTDSAEEKEKLQPHEHYVEVYPVKEKLSHI